MADTTPSSQPPQDDMHWGISYLREDIQDLKQEIRALQQRLDSVIEAMTTRFDATNQRTDSKFGQLLAAIVAFAGITIATVIGANYALLRLFLPGN